MPILAILILFIKIIHNLTDLHLSSVKDLNLNLLLTLAPTLLLLFVSWYKFDVFYDLKDEKEESKKELLLKEILEKIHPATRNEDRQLDTSQGVVSTRQEISQELSELTQLGTHTARDTDILQAAGDTAQATRPEADATGDTGDVVATPFATESDITPVTGGEATGETTPLIVNYKPDDYKTMT